MKFSHLSVGVLAACVLACGMAPGLTLDEASCAILTDIDTNGDAIIGLFDLVDHDLVVLLGGTWDAMDSEYIAVNTYGDGVLDSWQAGLLAAVLCSSGGDKNVDLPLVRSQFAANVALANSSLPGQAQQLSDDVVQLSALFTSIVAGIDATPAIQSLSVDFPSVGSLLGPSATGNTLARTLQSRVTSMAPYLTIVATLPGMISQVNNWVAAISGMSTEQAAMATQLIAMVADLLDDITDSQAALQLAVTNFGAAGTAQLPAQLEADMQAAASLMAGLGITLPAMQIYGVAKTANEPFSGFADWNEDGKTNAEHFDDIQAASGTRADWVAAVTAGSEIGTPVAGLMGLGLMGMLMSASGAVILRKRAKS